MLTAICLLTVHMCMHMDAYLCIFMIAGMARARGGEPAVSAGRSDFPGVALTERTSD